MDLTLMSTRAFCHVMSCLVIVVLGVRGECPPDAIQQAMMCTQSSGLGPPAAGPSAFISEGSAEKAKYACWNGDLLDAVNCIERVQAKCKDDQTDHAMFLRQMIDIENARDAVRYFCTHIKVYEKHASCIARHHVETKVCAQGVFESYKKLTEATQAMDVQMRYQCLFYWSATQCSTKVVREKCSSAAATLVGKVVTGFEAPFCKSMKYTISGGQTGVDGASGETGHFSTGSHVTSDSIAVLTLSVLSLVLSALVLSV